MKWVTLLAIGVLTLLAATSHPPRPAEAYTGCDLSASGLTQPHAGRTTNWRLFLKPTGNLKALMIFVDFSDARADEDSRALYDRFAGSAGWYSSASRGAMSLTFGANYRWHRMPSPASSYGLTTTPSFSEARTFFRDALRAANGGVNYRAYDMVYVVAARRAGFFTYPFYAKAGDGVAVDGVEIRHGMAIGSNARDRWGPAVLHHEAGHLFGLPDLYAFSYSSYYDQFRFAGNWDVMSSHVSAGPYLAWHQYKLGWLARTQTACLARVGSQTKTLTPMESAADGKKAIFVRTGASTLFAVEVRTLKGNDARYCDSGVVVSKIDADTPSGHGPVRVMPAAASTNATKKARCGPLYNAAFGVGDGQVSLFHDAESRVKVIVLSTDGNSYRVRVTRY